MVNEPMAIKIAFRVLVIRLSDGSWWPVLTSSPECPTPTYIVLHQGNMGGFSEEEWIRKYTLAEQAEDNEFKFVDIGTVEF